MDRSLFDTTVVSDIMQPAAKRLPAVAQRIPIYLAAHGQFGFSQLTCYEILRGLRKSGATRKLRLFAEFCQHSELLPVSYEILDLAATLWADGQQRGIVVQDVDLVIAATALHHGLPLATSNQRHFDWIAGLRLSNWRDPL